MEKMEKTRAEENLNLANFNPVSTSKVHNSFTGISNNVANAIVWRNFYEHSYC